MCVARAGVRVPGVRTGRRAKVASAGASSVYVHTILGADDESDRRAVRETRGAARRKSMEEDFIVEPKCNHGHGDAICKKARGARGTELTQSRGFVAPHLSSPLHQSDLVQRQRVNPAR